MPNLLFGTLACLAALGLLIVKGRESVQTLAGIGIIFALLAIAWK